MSLAEFEITKEQIREIWPAIDTVSSTCAELGINYVVIGAAARDLHLKAIYGIELLRATTDVDIGIAVREWDDFNVLVSRFESKGFSRKGIEHRVNKGPLVIDIIPFGEIVDGKARLVWPGSERMMSVLGFAEVFEAAVQFHIDGDPSVRVASLPGVAVLKLIAWSERPAERRQDPPDLCIIIKNYEEVVGLDLYGQHVDVLDDQFDTRYAHARILGRDIAPLLQSNELRETILGILDANLTDVYDSPLADAMGPDCYRERAVRIRCLESLRQGILDRLEL